MPEVSLAELRARGVLEFGDGYRTKRSEHGYPGFRILRVADIADGNVRTTGPDFVSAARARAIGPKLSQPGDVLLTTKGTVGRVAIYPNSSEQVVYSPQLCYFRVLDETVLHPRLLAYWFKSEAFLEQAARRANNTDMAAYINLRDIASLTLDLPHADEQRAITEVLGAIDDKIATNTIAIHHADELGGAIAARAVDGTTRPLVQLAELTMGSSPPGESYNESGVGMSFHQGVRDFGVRFPGRRVWTTAAIRLAQPLDTLISVRAPVGRINIAVDELCLGRGLAGARSRIGTPWTLFHQLRAAQDEWAPFDAVGTVFGAINRGQLEAVPMPVITAGAEVETELRIAALENQILGKVRESEQMAAARDELLPLLMSGRITVRDAEEVTESVT